jgi:acyl-CoA synthetase (AMP-forming)/AMP-acid ligase II
LLRIRHFARRSRLVSINPRNEAAENQFILDAFDCSLLLFHSGFAPMVDKLRPDLPKLRKLVCLDTDMSFAPSFERWLADVDGQPFQRDPVDDLALIPGTGGTTGKPKGVMLSGRNIETMTALTLMGYPFKGRPTYLALAPLTHAAGVLCFPIMTLGRQRGDHASSRHRRIPRSDRTLPGHAHIPSANRHLHAAGSSEARKR